jgi:hypothetical protein
LDHLVVRTVQTYCGKAKAPKSADNAWLHDTQKCHLRSRKSLGARYTPTIYKLCLNSQPEAQLAQLPTTTVNDHRKHPAVHQAHESPS